jgi:hypothetical protein
MVRGNRCIVAVICRKLQFKLIQRVMASTLEQLLARRNTWRQDIQLEVFEGQKNIFRHVPAEKERKVFFDLTCGQEIPVSLFEFELRALFEEATVKSGCKWWSRNSRPSRAEKNVSRSLHSMTCGLHSARMSSVVRLAFNRPSHS